MEQTSEHNLDQTILDDLQTTAVSHTYAGFWIRFGAAFIDGLMLVVFNYLSGMVLGPLVGGIVYFVVGVLYYSLMESSSYQGTLGKMAVGIKVISEDGNTLSFGQAIARYFMRIVSAFILLIGYLMMLWDDKKQTLHDKVVGSVVVYR